MNKKANNGLTAQCVVPAARETIALHHSAINEEAGTRDFGIWVNRNEMQGACFIPRTHSFIHCDSLLEISIAGRDKEAMYAPRSSAART